ncbi:hypothetical protein PPL_06845 [Heterostelium album PN500]|uniref:Serine protease n=1 Tax=Heterostelium pallidum (strain ATCC 26659 / Pp 5 / PN500) TaxID=670386 RepID=D3BDP3_HETP5|nr:hypothetical protein PPL_06845 [Heterostelium album PN500]EFA80024.1 hypothetical protein PPL_06845 [Heterostelium album PN500]|eukprot:XP_020432144.1 hypothetical protein PPL_06845 [Heterostelium album PN500]
MCYKRMKSTVEELPPIVVTQEKDIDKDKDNDALNTQSMKRLNLSGSILSNYKTTPPASPSKVLLNMNCAERVFHQSGKVEGHLFTLNSKSKIPSSVKLECTKRSNLEVTSNSVGRIFVRLKGGDKISWFTGTGFCVSHDKVITAAHVVNFDLNNSTTTTTSGLTSIKRINSRSSLSDDVSWSMDKIYICFIPDTSIDHEVDTNSLEENDDFYELETCGRQDIDQHFKDHLVYIKQTDDNKSVSYKWKTIKNDIEVLRFKNPQKRREEYLLPSFTSKENLKEFWCCGYPGHIELEVFQDDYQGKDVDMKELYNSVNKMTSGFQKKTIALSESAHIHDNQYLSVHQCPTLKGMSGGIIASSNEANKFLGVHIGGSNDTDIHTNFAISVTHPLFCYVYQKHILSDQHFMSKHRDQLQPYINYINNFNFPKNNDLLPP